MRDDMPEEIKWEWLAHAEMEDRTAGSQTLACSAGACEVVDIGASNV